ncbi:MAG: phosphatidylglycerophosphatase A [Deltaproteobacteria bacterium]|nr:phosphatidylglycerophosphatase A [Deltaproteobacteria bacterium]
MTQSRFSNSLVCFGASAGFAGYAPIASGTVGTAVAVPLAWGMAHLPLWASATIIVVATIAACAVNHAAGKIYRVSDAHEIVSDEVVGFLITMWAVPWSDFSVAVGFFFFRLFDVWKPWPARYFDSKIHNGIGVTLDDVAAGIYAALATHGAVAVADRFNWPLFLAF